jgi:pSer/pThr/pTyr-binding forkhead associated (FHA) protein
MNKHQTCFVEILTSDGIDGIYPKFELVNQRTTFGRHSSCTIQIGLDNLHVSNRHAEIILDGTKVFIEDLNSTNHIFVNNEQVTKIELKHNDIIRFGAQGLQLRLIIENHLPVIDVSPQSSDQALHLLNQSADTDIVSFELKSDESDDSILFDVSPDSENSDIPNPFPYDTVHKELINNPDDSNVSKAHLNLDTDELVFDVSKNLMNSDYSLPATDNPIQNAITSNAIRSDGSKVQKYILEDDDLFNVSPETDKRNLPESVADKQIDNILGKANSDGTESNNLQVSSIDFQLFDISPGTESIEFDAPFHISNTMEISSRLQQQMMSTQDFDVLAKNSKTREKILENKNIPEQQKRLIASATNAYTKMRRKYFVFFGIVIVLLCAGIIWFANGYFSYKHQFSKARALKNQVASFDQLFERARMQDENDGSKLVVLYKKLQKVQSQFDSVKAKLELKDQQKIYSDTVELFLDEVMAELNEKNYSIPQHMLERVKYYINLFTTEKRKSTEILFRRREIYFHEIENIFKQKSVPTILGYVAMQESLLDTNIMSAAGAVGMWQFMESTGRRFNLVIKGSTDERLDWRKSTLAASNYFRSLLLLFGDGRGALLAIAAYNAGEDKISKALANVEDPVRDRDFWYLYRTSSTLATETREYVPQVLARIIIDRNPGLYGFK